MDVSCRKIGCNCRSNSEEVVTDVILKDGVNIAGWCKDCSSEDGAWSSECKDIRCPERVSHEKVSFVDDLSVWVESWDDLLDLIVSEAVCNGGEELDNAWVNVRVVSFVFWEVLSEDVRKIVLIGDLLDVSNHHSSCGLEDLFIAPVRVALVEEGCSSVVLSEEDSVEGEKSNVDVSSEVSGGEELALRSSLRGGHELEESSVGKSVDWWIVSILSWRSLHKSSPPETDSVDGLDIGSIDKGCIKPCGDKVGELEWVSWSSSSVISKCCSAESHGLGSSCKAVEVLVSLWNWDVEWNALA